MSFSTVATQNSVVGPEQFADMMQATAPRFVVDGPNDLRPSYSSGVVSIQPGSALIGGARVQATGSNSVRLPTVSYGARSYMVCLRVNWSKSTSEAVELVALQNAQTNTTNTPNTSKVNRIPGVLYDAIICEALVSSGRVTLTDYRVWGGDGGTLRVTPEALNTPSGLDLRRGAMISTDRGTYTKRLDDDGVWRDVGTASNPWKQWQPVLRYYGNDSGYNGSEPGTAVNLGTGGQYKGYYRVVDGMLDGFISITTGVGNQFGTGQITVDLPLKCAAWMPDTWSYGHLYISTQNGADRNLDFPMEILVKAGWMRGALFAPVAGDYSNVEVHASSWDGGPGTGVPKLASGWSVGSVYTMHVAYPVND